MIEVTRERFEVLVGDALDSIPDDLWAEVDNVVVVVEDRPPEDEPDLFGLYVGIPLTERGDYTAVLPDRIEIYRHTLCAACNSEQEITDEVRITVIHEVAHHFGIDDEQLHHLGWA